MLDGLLTGSASQFMPRTADNKLQFQLEAFQFQGVPNGTVSMCNIVSLMWHVCWTSTESITADNNKPSTLFQQLYITCHLTAIKSSDAIDYEHRACSFNNGWGHTDDVKVWF